jgi:signal transduction histidine kinase/CheY-like chemotaxis protein
MTAGFLLVIAAVVAALWDQAQQQQGFLEVAHTLQVQGQLRTVLSSLQDAETGQRGYLLTGHPEFLEPYDAALASLDGDLASLDRLVADNPGQAAAARRLRALAMEREEILRHTITLYRKGDRAAATDFPRFAQGKALMDAVRREVAGMDAQERRTLAKREERLRRQTLGATAVLAFAAVASLFLSVIVILDTRRRLALALRIGADLALANSRLETEALTREAAEGQLRQMQKIDAIGQLTGGVAHDFNNMLAIILGSLDLARRRLKSAPDKAAAAIDNAVEGAERAAQLTGRLLAFARRQPLEPRTLDMNKLVGGMSELLRRTLGEDVRIETVLAGGLWRTHADPNQLESAILNLAVNARDAMPGGGKLTLETANTHLDEAYAAAHAEVVAGQYVCLSVTDTGSGMSTEVLERAFDPFYTTKGIGRGTGLGLSQVHGFVKQTGGHVAIYSEPGIGTTLKIYLPRDRRPEAPAAAPAAGTQAPGAKPGEIVLVVEDEERVRRLSVDCLRELGYTVIEAADAAGARDALNVQPHIDLLFTDVVMPDVSGRALADEARKARPGLKVLYTTGYTPNAIVHNGMLDPGVALITKPFSMEQLAAKVRQVLDAPAREGV